MVEIASQRLMVRAARIIVTLPRGLDPLEVPRGKTPRVGVELAQARCHAVLGKLDLDLRLGERDGDAAHRAGRADPHPSPSTIRRTPGQSATLNGPARFSQQFVTAHRNGCGHSADTRACVQIKTVPNGT